MTRVHKSVVLLFLLALSSMLGLLSPAESGSSSFLKTVGKATVKVGTEFITSMAQSAGNEVGRAAVERLLEQYRPPQAGENAPSYQTPYGTLSYQLQGYSNGVPVYQPVLIPLSPVYSAVASICVTTVGWCPPVMPIPQGAVCICPTVYGNIYGIAQ
jgi:hypothetical protein